MTKHKVKGKHVAFVVAVLASAYLLAMRISKNAAQQERWNHDIAIAERDLFFKVAADMVW